jgi:hypothetical protein
MTLWLETSKGFVQWRGEAIDGKRHPINIEDLWTAEDLAAIGLFKPEEPEIPEGKVIVGQRVAREDGVVKIIYQFQDSPPPPPPPPDLVAEIEAIKIEIAAIKPRLTELESKTATIVK